MTEKNKKLEEFKNQIFDENLAYHEAVNILRALEIQLPDRKKQSVFNEIIKLKEQILLEIEQEIKSEKSGEPQKSTDVKKSAEPKKGIEPKKRIEPKKSVVVLIPYILGPENGLELRYALRSIEKNLAIDNVKVMIVGDKPDWLQNCIHISQERISGMDYNTYLDQCSKIKEAIYHPEISPDFIYMYDDTFFINACTLENLKKARALEDMSTVDPWFAKTNASKRWQDIMIKTLLLLKEKNLPIFNYETHCPRVFNVDFMKKIFGWFSPEMNPFQISTLYYNHYYKKTKPQLIAPWGADFRLLIHTSFPLNVLNKKIKGRPVLNIGKNMISDKDMLMFLQQLFPEKSNYEK